MAHYHFTMHQQKQIMFKRYIMTFFLAELGEHLDGIAKTNPAQKVMTGEMPIITIFMFSMSWQNLIDILGMR